MIFEFLVVAILHHLFVSHEINPAGAEPSGLSPATCLSGLLDQNQRLQHLAGLNPMLLYI